MKIIVGRTVKIVCSRSESRVGSSDLDCTRARRVCSESTGAPQFEQNRTLGVTYAPQTEQVIGFSSFAHVSYKNEAATVEGSASLLFLIWFVIPPTKLVVPLDPSEVSSESKSGCHQLRWWDLGDTLRDYWLTSWRRPSGRRAMKTLRS